MSEYVKQANLFAKKHGIKLQVVGEPEYRKHFTDDKDSRWVFKMKLTRHGKSYVFHFGQSIASGGEEPNMYDILACLQKYDVGSFENFCSEFGYSEDSRSAYTTYLAVQKEWKAVDKLFGDILEEMQEIS